MSSLLGTPAVELQKALGNRNLTFAVLAINLAGAATVKTTSAYTYMVDGVLKTKAALAAQSIAVTHTAMGVPVAVAAAYVQPVSTTVYYVLALDAAGAVYVVQGTFAGQVVPAVPLYHQTFNGVGGVPQVNQLPVNVTPVGIIKIATNASTTFTPATTLLDAAGITATYFDVSVLPTVAP